MPLQQLLAVAAADELEAQRHLVRVRVRGGGRVMVRVKVGTQASNTVRLLVRATVRGRGRSLTWWLPT